MLTKINGRCRDGGQRNYATKILSPGYRAQQDCLARAAVLRGSLYNAPL
ncbi:hypothetical protein NB311A_01924 [Nitrobacter sp. Nb-311A]|nr:hypothetical protein NB311A_01924 [Nitrobacter sp. Nb-311A]